jgi:transcription antitermination factor NusG
MAEKALRNRRYLVYRPIIPMKTRMSHGYPKNGNYSMFPSYLFVLPNSQGWETLRTSPGMMYGDNALLRLNGSLAKISHNDPNRIGIVQIRQMEESLWNVEENKDEPQWRIGDAVRIRKGPFIELLGEIATLDETARIGILLDILGARRLVYVSPAHIISAEA